ncbi:hypothetical protein OE88DRAFT_1539887 [Heliocybe sulcata]|uniref:Uncharacterized protein n=1 Tax=Heliocybe sulcata TaxID=5364 RepID=A0A5C3N4L3_9AGAM|nr:hypothetical protein OE88DRAFT_1539887 [Heliocybe sulcata]
MMSLVRLCAFLSLSGVILVRSLWVYSLVAYPCPCLSIPLSWRRFGFTYHMYSSESNFIRCLQVDSAHIARLDFRFIGVAGDVICIAYTCIYMLIHV